MFTTRTLLTAPVLVAALASTGELPAQLPFGHLVTASFRTTAPSFPGLGGLHFVDPATGAVTPLTGVPCEMVGSCPSSAAEEGADLALHLPTRQILVSGWGDVNRPVTAYLLDVAGSTVTSSVRYDLATITSPNGLGNPGAALLPDGRVLLAMDPRNCGAPGPLAGEVLGILDPSLPPTDPAALTPVPVAPPLTGVATNGVVVDADLGVAYVLAFPTWQAQIFSVPLPGGGAPALVATVPGRINAIALEPDGRILAGGGQSGVGRLWRVDPLTGQVQGFPQSFGSTWQINAMSIDPVSGDLFVAMPDNSIARLSPRTLSGTVTTVASPPPAGWGRLSGLAIGSPLATYGSGSGTLPPARWGLAPNPGGDPSIGNASFSVTNAADSAPFAIWVVGFGATTLPLTTTPPLDLLVVPQVSTLVPTVPAAGSTLPLPIPAAPSFAGLQLFLQCALTNGGGLTASSGLRLTLH